MRGAQDDPRGAAGLERLLPAGSAQTPPVSGREPGKADFRHRRRQIIAARPRELEERVRHDRADGVAAEVLPAGVAAPVAEEARHRFDRADLEALAEDVAALAASAAAVSRILAN